MNSFDPTAHPRATGSGRFVVAPRTEPGGTLLAPALPGGEPVDGWFDLSASPNGRSFGGYQVDDDIEHRYVRPLGDGTFLVVSDSYAVESRFDGDEPPGDADEDALTWRYHWSERIETTHCRDWQDPGSTELTTDIEYGEGSYTSFASIEEARADAQRHAATDIRSTFGPVESFLR